MKIQPTDKSLIDAVPKDKPYKLGIGLGLFLLVMTTGAKYWRFKYRFLGKYKGLSLGVFPDVDLQSAIVARDEARQQIKEGHDPSVIRRNAKNVLISEGESISARRYSISNDGSLTIKYHNKSIIFTPTETAELLRFLNSTRSVQSPGAI